MTETAIDLASVGHTDIAHSLGRHANSLAVQGERLSQISRSREELPAHMKLSGMFSAPLHDLQRAIDELTGN
jgi:hypothetical protein